MEPTNTGALPDNHTTTSREVVCAKADISVVFFLRQNSSIPAGFDARAFLDCVEKHAHGDETIEAVDVCLMITDSGEKGFFVDGIDVNDMRFKFITGRLKSDNFSMLFYEVPAVDIQGISRPQMVRYAKKYLNKTSQKAESAETAVRL